MAIEFLCRVCTEPLQIPDGVTGQIQCGECRTLVAIPGSAEATSPPPRPASKPHIGLVEILDESADQAADRRNLMVLWAIFGCAVVIGLVWSFVFPAQGLTGR